MQAPVFEQDGIALSPCG